MLLADAFIHLGAGVLMVRHKCASASSAQASETQRRRTSVRSRNERARGALFESKRTRRRGSRAAASMTAQMLVPIVRPLSARTQLNWEIRPRLPMGDEAFFQSVSLCDEAPANFWPYVRARRDCGCALVLKWEGKHFPGPYHSG